MLRPGQAIFVLLGSSATRRSLCPESLREFNVSFLAYKSLHLLDFLDQCGYYERENVLVPGECTFGQICTIIASLVTS